MSLVTELAERAHAVARDPLPERVREATRTHLADTVGAVLAGHTTLHEPARRLADGVGLRPGPRRTAFITGIYANAWEVAGVHRAAVLVPGCVVLPAALAALELRPDVAWEEFLRAYVAGYEVALAAALAIGGDQLIAEGWWPTALVAPLGGAAAVSLLLGQPSEDTAAAIGLAAQQAGGMVAGSTAAADGRYLLSGMAADRAVGAVLAVGAGWRGPVDVLDDIRSPMRRQSALRSGFLLPETSMKVHAGAKHMQAAIDAVSTVDAAGGVLGIRCALPAQLVRPVDRPPPFVSSLHALASAQFMLAVSVVRGRCSPWEFRPELLADEEIVGLAERVTVIPADDLSAAYPASWGARVEVSTPSGTVRVERRDARGDPGHELSTPELVAKFVTLAGPSLGDGPAGDLVGTLLGARGVAPRTALLDVVLPLLHRKHAFQEV